MAEPILASEPTPSPSLGNGSGGGQKAENRGQKSGAGDSPPADGVHESSAPKNKPEPELCSKIDLAQQTEDAVRLLVYAAESGREVGDDVRGDILKATRAANGCMGEQTAQKFLGAVTILAARVSPVTAQSLKASENTTVWRYLIMAFLLIALIGPYSVLSFISSGLSDKIKQDVDVADGLAVKLNQELQPAKPKYEDPEGRGLVKPLPDVGVKDVLKDLQLFASTTRAIDRRTDQLMRLAFLNTQVATNALTRTNREVNLRMIATNVPAEAEVKTYVYQDVRYRAQIAQESVSLMYGAFANHVLPLLYALLGACACLARRLEQEIKDHTFRDRLSGQVIHLLVAAIGGLVVGLFANFNITQGASISPLAVAFLVGYGVDVFFRFLDTLVQGFNRGRESPATQTTGESAKN